MDSIPFSMFPTTVCLLDDNKESLEAVRARLKSTELNIITYTDPAEFLENVNGETLRKWIHTNIIENEEDEYEEHKVNINLKKISELIHFQQKIQQVSLVIVDYEMPGMNGLEVCRKIRDSDIQKILLTGMTSEEIAIRGFNDGIINKYIRKQDPDCMDKILETVKELQKNYFKTLFNELKIINTSFNDDTSPINSEEFSKIFTEITRDKEIIEYYIKSLQGNYIFGDRNGNKYHLYTVSDDEMNVLAENLEESLDIYPFAPSLLRDLQTRKVMIRPRDNGKLPPINMWDKEKIQVNYSCAARGQNFYISLILQNPNDEDTTSD